MQIWHSFIWSAGPDKRSPSNTYGYGVDKKQSVEKSTHSTHSTTERHTDTQREHSRAGWFGATQSREPKKMKRYDAQPRKKEAAKIVII